MTTRNFYLLHALLLVTSLTPLWLVDIPAFCDYLNHLARAYIAHNWSNSSALQENWVLNWKPAPYILFYFIVDMLQYLMNPYVAGKLVLSLCMVFNVVGVVRLSHYANGGRPSRATLLLYPLLYNYPFIMGFVSFALGSSMALLAFSFLIKDFDEKRLPWLKLLLFSPIIYFTHLYAWGLWVLILFFYLLKSLRPHFRYCILVGAVVLVIPVLVRIFGGDQDFNIGHSFTFGGWKYKSNAIFSPVFFMRTNVEYGVMLCLFVLLLAGILRVPKRYLILLCGLLLVAAATPFKLRSVAYLDIRLPPLLSFLFLGLCHFHLQAWRRKATIAVCSAFATLSVIRQVDFTERMMSCDQHFSLMRKAIRKYTEPGKSMEFFPRNYRYTTNCRIHVAQDHAGSAGVIENDLYIPNIFTNMPPVYAAPKREATHFNMSHDNCLVPVQKGLREPQIPFYWDNRSKFEVTPYAWTKLYDYVLYFNSGYKAGASPNMTLMYEDEDVQLYKVEH